MFSLSLPAKTCAVAGMLACAACAGVGPRPDLPLDPPSFYTVTAEIALSRHQARVAALQYATAAEDDRDPDLLRRATDVTRECLQPSLTARVAAHWIDVDPSEVDAHRAAARAALDLHKIDQSAAQYRLVLNSSPRGTDGEFAVLETELAGAGNVYGARQLADRLAGDFPASSAALRLQAFAALRADDPAAAARTFEAALAATTADPERRELTQGLWRAQVLAGDAGQPLARAKDLVDREPTAENRLDFALVLVAAQQDDAARTQLEMLAHDPESSAVALRLLGLLDFQEGKMDDAATRFAELVTTGKFLDDGLYYLGMIAERHGDLERALRLYAEVQSGENALPALLRAAAILRSHGAAPAADELLDQLASEQPQRAPDIMAARARIYADAGDLPQAMAVLDQGEQEYPDSVDLRYARASMEEEQGKISAALQELKAVAGSRPDDPAALNAYGYTLADNRRQLALARKLIERAHAAAPKNAAILDSLGWVLFRQGHGEQALPYLTAAYADVHDGDVAAHLGEVYWQLGRHDEAERVWTEASRPGLDNHLLNSTRLRLHAAN